MLSRWTPRGRQSAMAIWTRQFAEHSEEQMQKWAEERAKKKAEAERYNAEKEEYLTKMSELRKKFAAEHAANETRKAKERKSRIERADKMRMLLEEERMRVLQQVKAQRTSLEVEVPELIKETPEQREARLRQKKEDKVRVRQAVIEKLQEQRVQEEKEKEVYVEFLAREASGWITKDDLENGTLDDKIKAKLLKIQPVTATFQNALPKHHWEEAWRYVSDERLIDPRELILQQQLQQQQQQHNNDS